MKGISWFVVILGLGVFLLGCKVEPAPSGGGTPAESSGTMEETPEGVSEEAAEEGATEEAAEEGATEDMSEESGETPPAETPETEEPAVELDTSVETEN
jgi:hypothetical protein